jgi:hypothetical protein
MMSAGSGDGREIAAGNVTLDRANGGGKLDRLGK